MLVLLYLAEGIVRGMTDGGLSARLGWLEALLALVFFVCALAYVAPYKRAARAAKRAAHDGFVARTGAPGDVPMPSGQASRAG